MDNLLKKMQDDKIGFYIKIDEVNEREIDDDKYNDYMHDVEQLSSSMSTSEIADFLKLPYHQVQAMLEQIEREIEQEELELTAEMHEEHGIRKYEALSAEELLQDEENIRKYEMAESTAKKLLAENVDLDYISKVTGWTVGEIKALQYQIQKSLV